MARQIALDVARAELSALTSAMTDAFGAVLFANDLEGDGIGAGLKDVVSVFSSEIDRRIPLWIDVDPTVPTVPTEEKDMELSAQDRKAVEIAKAARLNPELKERMQRVDETRAARQPVSKMHPVSRFSEESAVLAEYENDVLELMSKEKISHEIAIGKIARDPAYHILKANYRAEQRAMRDG
jgi:hypothetical protein